MTDRADPRRRRRRARPARCVRRPAHEVTGITVRVRRARAVAGLRTRGRVSRTRHLLAVASRTRRVQCSMTAVVPTHRCGAVPDSHRVPSCDAPAWRTGRTSCTHHHRGSAPDPGQRISDRRSAGSAWSAGSDRWAGSDGGVGCGGQLLPAPQVPPAGTAAERGQCQRGDVQPPERLHRQCECPDDHRPHHRRLRRPPERGGPRRPRRIPAPPASVRPGRRVRAGTRRRAEPPKGRSARPTPHPARPRSPPPAAGRSTGPGPSHGRRVLARPAAPARRRSRHTVRTARADTGRRRAPLPRPPPPGGPRPRPAARHRRNGPRAARR